MENEGPVRTKYRFISHFNRINMQRGLKTVWTVHFRGRCYPAVEIKFQVPTRTRYREGARQPRAVIIGFASELVFEGDVAVLRP